ncbi:dynein heavy chain 6, axonemal [Etheostoma spectabile]|uniref:dynein heavy chain 6, axonemal n=1 Tax=Etheostoma spectabile TaxID=54343 RepID=UPI0013AEB8A0|nr:dynein heavy chain 6, axonemal-like [Etheostoma spectabile]
MASASPSPSDSLLNPPGQSRENNSRERRHKLLKLQNIDVPDIQSLLNRKVKRKEPSLKHLQARQQMYFPGWDTRSPSSQQTEPPHRQRQKPPVHLPPLESTTKANPSGYIQSPSSRPTKQPREKKQPVHLPPLQYRNKLFKNVPTPGHPKRPLDTVEVYEHSKDDYLMVTHKGVVSVYKEDYDFITHERWEEEYEYHCELSRIPFFALFKKLKPFHVWRTTVRREKIHLTRKSLQNCLFFVNQPLRSALIDIRKMCYQISDTGLFHIEKKHTYTLQEFQDVHYKQLQEVSSNLKKFQDLVKEVTVSACSNYLAELESRSHKLNEQKDRKSLPLLKTFQSSRLICFIRLVDYLVVNALHVLMVNVVTELLAGLQEPVRQTPSHGIIQSWNQPAEAASDPTEEQTEKKSVEPETRRDPPMFTSELMLDPHALTYKPSEENFQESFAEIIGGFKKAVMSVTTLTADPDLDSLTDPGDYKVVK